MTVVCRPHPGIYISIYNTCNLYYRVLIKVSIEKIIKNSQHSILHVLINGYGLPSVEQTRNVIEKINSSSNYDLIVLDKSAGPWDQDLEYLAWARSLNLNKPFVIVTSNYNYWFNKHDQIVYYPQWFFILMSDLNIKKHNIVDARPYKIACLSRNPWLHRSKNMLAMRRQSWFGECQYSFGSDNKLDFDTSADMTREDVNFLHSINHTKLSLPDNNNFYVSNHSSAHELCCIDYVTESRVDNVFVSEKSWKPLLSGQLFLILGPVGIIRYFKDLGVDVFDDLVDHAYDQETDLDKKIHLLMNSINGIIDHVDQIWADTVSRRQKNLDLVYSPDFHNMLAKDLISKVS